MATIGGITVNVRANTRQFAKGMKRVRSVLNKTGQSLIRFGAVAGAATAAVLAKSFATGEEFAQKMRQSLSIMSGVTKKLQKEMQEAALAVSGKTQFAASEAAEAYFFLASAGLDAAAAIKAMPVVATFAQAGMFDLALATDLLTDAQSAMGLSVRDNAEENIKQMTRVGDVLLKANTLANATAQQFSEALVGGIAADARSIGKPLEEVVAVLAAMADQGFKGAEASTLFSMALRDLQTKAIRNKDAFKDFGLSVFDSDGKMRNMADIIGQMESKFGGMSNELKKTTLLQLGFSDKSIKAINVLMGTSDAIRGFQTQLESAGGTMQNVSDSMLTPMQKALNKLGEAWTRFSVALQTSAAPMIAMIAESISQWALEAGNVANAAESIVAVFLKIADIVHGIKVGIQGIGASFVVMLGKIEPISGVNKGQVDKAVEDFRKVLIADTPSEIFERLKRKQEQQNANMTDPIAMKATEAIRDSGIGAMLGEEVAKSVGKTITASANTALTFGSTAASSFLNRQNANNFQKKQEKFQQDNLAGLDRVVNAVDRLQPVHVAFL